MMAQALQEPQPIVTRSRLRILGKRYATKQEYQAALDKQLLAFVNNRISKGENVSVVEIGRQLGKSGSVISRALSDLEARGLIKRENGRIAKSEAQRSQESYAHLNRDHFLEIPVIAEWYGKMEGNVKSRGLPITYLQTVCDTLKVHPTAFLVDVKTTDELFHNFETAYARENGEVSTRHYSMAIRNFMIRLGLTIPKGGTQYLSGEKENFGNYGDIYLSDQQIAGIRKYLEKKDEPEAALVFSLGTECFARPATLIQIRGSQIRFETDEGYPYASFEVYEGKTGRKFPKFVFDPWTVSELRRVVAANQGPLFSKGKDLTKSTIKHLDEQYSQLFKEAFASIGIDVRTHKFGELINYYKWRPLYVLRHTGAWLWRRRGAPMEKIVAMGWDDPGTFTKCYAHLDAKDLLQTGDCYLCHPPKVIDPAADAVFCKPRHALAYLNGVRSVAN